MMPQRRLLIVFFILFSMVMAAAFNNCKGVPGSSTSSGSTGGTQDTSTLGNPFNPTRLAALPKVILNARYPALPPNHQVLTVGNGRQYSSCQDAVDAAVPGDEVVIDAGYVCAPFRLRDKGASTDYIVIRSSESGQLPPEGTRLRTSDAPKLAVIETTTQYAAINTDLMAHHYYLLGLEVRMAASSAEKTSVLLELGDVSQGDLSKIPHDIVVARCWVHASPVQEAMGGILLNAGAVSVVDSLVTDIHRHDQYAKAILGWTLGAGPFKIVNNELVSSGSNFLIGRSPTNAANLVPSDIEFRDNYVHKLLEWRDPVTSTAGLTGTWVLDGLLNINNGQRILIDGNLFENRWIPPSGFTGQGFAVGLFPQTTNGVLQPWVRVQDITFRNNLLRHVAGALIIKFQDPNNPGALAQRLEITNNLGYDIGGAATGDSPSLVRYEYQGPGATILDHNTLVANTDSVQDVISAGTGASAPQSFITNNILSAAGHGFGQTQLDSSFPSVTFTGNVLVGQTANLYGSYAVSNFFPGSTAQVGFTLDPALGVSTYTDLQLLPSSQFTGSGVNFGLLSGKIF